MHNKFKHDLNILFYDKMMADPKFCERVYAAITNIIWVHSTDEVSVTFRAAGGVIAGILNEGCYMDWYCCTGEGLVAQEIADAMQTLGWTWKEWPPQDPSYYM